MTPQLVVLAGPNGAGKSTFYDAFLAGSPLPFLNADHFAAETGIDSFEAARILDATRDRFIADRLGFITETVFSDPHGHKLGMLRAAAVAGYDITLVYIGVASADLLAARIDRRVAAGGHDVPRDRVASRFERSLANLREAIPIATTVKLYDNTSADEPYRLVAVFTVGELTFRATGRLPRWVGAVLPRKPTGSGPRR
jgi:predicted ABC-type ATPase